MRTQLRCVFLVAVATFAARAQPVLAGFSTSVPLLDADGAWVYLFVDGSAGSRSVLISAAGPGYAAQTGARVVSDPQIEVLDPSGNRLAFNDDRTEAMLADASLPSYARSAKDAALRVSLPTGAYVVHVRGVNGATGTVGLDVIDSGARPGLASLALRARCESNVSVRVRVSGTGNMRLGTFVSGPNLPVSNPMEDPRLFLGVGAYSAQHDELTGGSAPFAARYRSPVVAHGKNAGHVALYTFTGSEATTATIVNQTNATGGMFLLELHNTDSTVLRAPVVYVPPQSLTLNTGASAFLQAIIGGDESTTVRFERDGLDLGASSSAQYGILGAVAGHGGSYRVRATSAAGMALSAPAVVTVTPPAPFITGHPVSTAVFAGMPLELTANVTGTNLSYQWLKDGLEIPGATSVRLVFAAVKETDAGSYTLRVTNGGGSVVSFPGNIAVTPAEPGRLTNLSVRAVAGVGDRTLIVGFTLGGSGAKPILIRGIGPGLGAFGLTNFNPDPRLGLFVGANEIASNNDWSPDDGRALGAFPLVGGSRDSVLVSTLSAQAFTAQATGVGGAVGETLIELYDTSPSYLALRLANLSVRSQLDDGQRLIVGLTISGRTSTKLLLRAVGPTLAAFGVDSAHPDPELRLYSGETLIAQNDQWRGDDGRGSGAFPLGASSNDAALVFPVGSGSYSMHVLGARGTSGIVLVEVYEVP